MNLDSLSHFSLIPEKNRLFFYNKYDLFLIISEDKTEPENYYISDNYKRLFLYYRN